MAASLLLALAIVLLALDFWSFFGVLGGALLAGALWLVWHAVKARVAAPAGLTLQ